jgi:hypothetical protein
MRQHGLSAIQPRGFLLMEVVGYLAIMAAVALVLSDLWITLGKVTRETTARNNLITRVDTAMNELRRDAWAARSFRISSSGTRVEIQKDQEMVVWEMAADGLLTRTQGAAGPGNPRSWQNMPKVNFAAKGAVLVVAVDSGPGATKHEEMSLVSQWLAGGGS